MSKIIGTKKDDILRGTNGNDTLLGKDGDDTLFGGGGNDTLDGGNGDDELLGGDGDDFLFCYGAGEKQMDGGKGVDTLSFAKSAFGVDLGSEVHGTVLIDGIVSSFRRVENFIGSDFQDLMFAYDGGYVYGGKGPDQIGVKGGLARGGAGDDIIYMDNAGTADDTVWLERGQGLDSINGFNSGQDTVRLSAKEFDLGALVGVSEFTFTNGNTNAVGTRAQLIFNDASNALYYDPDGTGSMPAELLGDFSGSGILEWYDFEIV